jgi:hypothetical protein
MLWVEKLSIEELHALADGDLDIESYRPEAGNRPH